MVWLSRSTRRAALLLALSGLLAAVSAAPAAAQRTRDQAQLAISFMPGYVWGSDLWSIARQPIPASVEGGQLIFDTLAISRSIRPSVSLGFAGSFFPGDHFGLGAEATLLGVGYRDQCRVVSNTSGAVRPVAVCTGTPGGINNAEKTASAVIVSVSGIARINSRKQMSPYIRASIGALFSNQSSIRTIGVDAHDSTSGPVDVIVYDDNRNSRITPAFVGAIGFTAHLAPGYQFRTEFRDNVVGVRAVTAATTSDLQIPPSAIRYKHLPGVFFGLDVVLERRRGRRY